MSQDQEPSNISQRKQFLPEQHRRGTRSNILRGIAALTEMLDLVGNESATDSEVAKILVENELELRELRWSAMRNLTTLGQQK